MDGDVGQTLQKVGFLCSVTERHYCSFGSLCGWILVSAGIKLTTFIILTLYCPCFLLLLLLMKKRLKQQLTLSVETHHVALETFDKMKSIKDTKLLSNLVLNISLMSKSQRVDLF